MLYYPQLTSGAVSQLPVTHRTTVRTVINEMAGGDRLRMSDPGAAAIRWQLQYSNVTDAEWAAIDQLFETAEGRLTAFTFLDPTGNLLMWSEDWTKAIWTADPLLQVAGTFQDPLGASHAMQLTNTAQATQRIVQTIAAASWFQYCFSVYLRSDVPATVQLVTTASGQESLSPVTTGPVWTRTASPGQLTVTQDGVGFGLQLPAGIRIQAFGAQVEAQRAASEYKKTIDRGGVSPKTRFDTDSLTLTTTAPNQNSGNVNLHSSLV
jgi:hypothetical protein